MSPVLAFQGFTSHGSRQALNGFIVGPGEIDDSPAGGRRRNRNQNTRFGKSSRLWFSSTIRQTNELHITRMSEAEVHLSTRKEEILSLSYIYDELQLNEDQVSGSLVIPVELDLPTRLKCIRAEDEVRFLPGINFVFGTGDKYPESAPPEVSLQCSWLSREKLKDVEKEVLQIWETSKELCLFNMIDEISERAKNLFGLETLDLSEPLFEEVVGFAETEEHIRFEQGTYFCGVCLENKKGTECFKLSRCGHIFCQVRSFLRSHDNPSLVCTMELIR